MLLREAIEDCLLYLQPEQAVSKETIRTYRPSHSNKLERPTDAGGKAQAGK